MVTNVSSEFINGDLIFRDKDGAAILTLDGTNSRATVAGNIKTARSVWFNLDNGAGVTIDDVILRPSVAVTITAARIVYVDATSGTVAAGNARIGTALGGDQVVAATAYENAAAVGTATAMTIVSGAVAAGGSVFVRHTGVAATAAGHVVVEIEYTVDA